MNMKQGLVPDGYQVHHKVPLGDIGTKDFSNDPSHRVLTNSHRGLTKGMQVGESIESR